MEQTEKIKCKTKLPPPIKRHRTSITLLKQFMRRYCGGCLSTNHLKDIQSLDHFIPEEITKTMIIQTTAL